jgi:ABC-type Fe3+-hydroxamate transport system substrate-binding protein
MKLSKSGVCGLGLVTALTTPACGGSAEAPDRSGPPARIVSLIPAATEIVFALGGGERLVGRTRWGVHPPEASAVADVGDGIRPSIEAIVARDPDLVIAFDGLDNEGLANRLDDLGIRTLRLRHNTLADLERNIRLIGDAIGCPLSARVVNERISGQLATASPDAPRGEAIRVYYDVWADPPMTIGRGSFLDSLITLAGGRNVFGDLGAPSPEVGLEAIVHRDPEIVLHPVSTSPASLPISPVERPGWRAVKAVADGRVRKVDADLLGRLGPRIGESVRHLAEAIGGVEMQDIAPIPPVGECRP